MIRTIFRRYLRHIPDAGGALWFVVSWFRESL